MRNNDWVLSRRCFSAALLLALAATAACSADFGPCAARDCAAQNGAGAGTGAAGSGQADGGAAEDGSGDDSATGLADLPGVGGARSSAGGSDAAAAGAAGAPNAAQAGGAGQGGEGGAEPSDTTPPEVLSITPSDGAKGVTKDTPIVVTFSEPMDKPSTEAAITSPELAGAFSVSWDAAGTVLTITPNPSLSYAQGTNADFAAKSYTVGVTASAKDAPGNPLASASSSTFSTLRQINLAFSDPSPVSFADSSPLTQFVVGDQASENIDFRGLTQFDISTLPAELTAIESATLEVSVVAIWGAPFPALGGLTVDHIHSAGFDVSCYASAALSNLGVLATTASAGSTLTLDVTSAVKDDYDNRASRDDESQYRLQFALETDNDLHSDYVQLGANGHGTNPRLEVSYLVP